VGITTVEVYLKVNKIWKRRGEQEVANAQSFLGLSLSFFSSTVWVVKYGLESNYGGLTEYSIFIVETFVFILIGTGIFVRGNRQLSIWHLIKQTLRMERKEANYLLKKLFQPQNADDIISILYQLAVIDDDFDEKERKLIDSFANEWNISIDYDQIAKEMPDSKEAGFMHLRKSVIDYLETQPPVEQVAVFKDMVTALIEADDKITDEEALISDELVTLVESYIKSESTTNKFHVIIVPQDQSHDGIIKELLPESKRLNTPGGYVYSMGSYYSKKYADMICRQFRKNNLLTLVLEPEEYDETIK
jgi:hypothetical protein